MNKTTESVKARETAIAERLKAMWNEYTIGQSLDLIDEDMPKLIKELTRR